MKKINILLILMAICCLPGMAFAKTLSQQYKLGIGVIAGEPTGLTAKYNIDAKMSIDGGIGWNTSGDDEIHFYGTFLYHMYDLIKVPKGNLPLYFGGGFRFLNRENKDYRNNDDDDDDKFGIRIPVGVEYQFENLPLGAFAELAPVVNLTPDTDLDIEGGIGIRFFFLK